MQQQTGALYTQLHKRYEGIAKYQEELQRREKDQLDAVKLLKLTDKYVSWGSESVTGM